MTWECRNVWSRLCSQSRIFMATRSDSLRLFPFLVKLTMFLTILPQRKEWTHDDRKKRRERTHLESVMTRICIMCLEQRLLSFLTLQLAQLAALTRWRAGPLAYSLPCRSERTGSMSHVRGLADSSSNASRWWNKHFILSLCQRGGRRLLWPSDWTSLPNHMPSHNTTELVWKILVCAPQIERRDGFKSRLQVFPPVKQDKCQTNKWLSSFHSRPSSSNIYKRTMCIAQYLFPVTDCYHVLQGLPRFKGLDRGCIFRGATSRLTLPCCDGRFPQINRKMYTFSRFTMEGKHGLCSCSSWKMLFVRTELIHTRS